MGLAHLPLSVQYADLPSRLNHANSQFHKHSQLFLPFAVLLELFLIKDKGVLPLLKMIGNGPKAVELSGDIEFIKTPAAKAHAFGTVEDCGIDISNVGS
jgi:hypothetical protein